MANQHKCKKCGIVRDRLCFVPYFVGKNQKGIYCSFCHDKRANDQLTASLQKELEKANPILRKEKHCARCKQLKPLSAYSQRLGVRDGRMSACRECETRIKAARKKQAKMLKKGGGTEECRYPFIIHFDWKYHKPSIKYIIELNKDKIPIL